MKTIAQLAQEALDIQNACNLCGLAQRFAEVNKELFHHLFEVGTLKRNNHPIIIVWLDKLNSLAGIQEWGREEITDAYAEVSKLAKSDNVDPLAESHMEVTNG